MDLVPPSSQMRRSDPRKPHSEIKGQRVNRREYNLLRCGPLASRSVRYGSSETEEENDRPR